MRSERRLSYSLAGDTASERTVVYLHGAVLGNAMWHAQRDRIAGQRQVFVELPGAGASRHLRWRSMDDTARLVHRVIDEVSPERPVGLVGVSLGGDLGARVVSQGPQRVERAVLSGMIARPQRPWGEVWQAWRQVPQLRSPQLLTHFAEYNRVPRPEIDKLIRDAATMRYSDYVRTLASVYRGIDLVALGPVRTPVLAVCGETEHLVAREAVGDLVRACPSVVGVLAAGLGHAWHAEDPERFAAVTTSFLEAGELAGGLQPIT